MMLNNNKAKEEKRMQKLPYIYYKYKYSSGHGILAIF
jgi:hypothetical protein